MGKVKHLKNRRKKFEIKTMDLTYAEFSAGLKKADLNSTFREKKTFSDRLRKVAKKLVKLALPDKPRKLSKTTISRSSKRYRPFDPTQNYRVIYMC